MKKHSGSDTARTASLTDLRRWPGDGFFGMKPNSGRAKSEAKAKSENRPRCRAKSESRPRWKNPDLGAAQARQAGGSDAGQGRNCRIRRQFRKKKSWEESRPWARQGSDAGQARPGGYARQECGALGVGRARTHWASHQTRLGEPVFIG